MRNSAILLTFALGAAALVGGCGGRPVGLAGEDDARLGARGDRTATLLEGLRRAYADLKTLSGRVTRRELDPDSGAVRTSIFAFESDIKKHWIRGLIEQSAAPNAQGARFIFRDDGQVKIRVKIGFLPITRTFPADDENVTSIRHYRIDQTDFAAMALTALAKGAQVRSLGTSEEFGREVDLIRVTPSGLPDATHEDIGLDPTSHLPVMRRAFGGSPGEGGAYRALPYLPGLEVAQEILTANLEDEARNPELDLDGWDF